MRLNNTIMLKEIIGKKNAIHSTDDNVIKIYTKRDSDIQYKYLCNVLSELSKYFLNYN